VNLTDFNVLAGNFGLSGAATGPTAQNWSALSVVVPEPASAGLLVPGAALLGRRRRRAG
jgi:hypothetical protein